MSYKLVVGLGNPGSEYENTRHNVGFRCIDILADEHNISVLECKHKAMLGKGYIEGTSGTVRGRDGKYYGRGRLLP